MWLTFFSFVMLDQIEQNVKLVSYKNEVGDTTAA